jgi:hypothetical protein
MALRSRLPPEHHAQGRRRHRSQAPREHPVRQTRATEIARHWPAGVPGPKSQRRDIKRASVTIPSTLAAWPLREPRTNAETAANPHVDGPSGDRCPGVPSEGSPKTSPTSRPAAILGAAIRAMVVPGRRREALTQAPTVALRSARARWPLTYTTAAAVASRPRQPSGCSTPCVMTVESRTPRLVGRLIITPANHKGPVPIACRERLGASCAPSSKPR